MKKNSKKDICNTLVVNFYGGPGSGKSSMAAGVFSQLKWNEVNCELSSEFAKDLTWEHRHKTLGNQIYVFGKQHHKIYRLVGEVDVIVTDSPILLTPIYDSEKRQSLKRLVFEEYDKTNNFNIFLNRKKKYNPKGRNQTEKQSKQIDNRIKSFLKENMIPFNEMDGTKSSIDEIVKNVMKYLKSYKGKK